MSIFRCVKASSVHAFNIVYLSTCDMLSVYIWYNALACRKLFMTINIPIHEMVMDQFNFQLSVLIIQQYLNVCFSSYIYSPSRCLRLASLIMDHVCMICFSCIFKDELYFYIFIFNMDEPIINVFMCYYQTQWYVAYIHGICKFKKKFKISNPNCQVLFFSSPLIPIYKLMWLTC